jgi:hypothetical protein
MPQSPVSTARRGQAAIGSAARGDLADPVAPLRALPELAIGPLLEPAEPPAGAPGHPFVRAQAWRDGRTGPTHLRINSHVHLPPNFSAFDSVEQAVELAADAGLRALGASNYYDFGVYARFTQAALARSVFPLFGVEIISLLEELQAAGLRVNDPHNPGRMYLCGKGITGFAPMSDEAHRLMARIREADGARIDAMIERMNALMKKAGAATPLTAGSIRSALAKRHSVPPSSVCLQERHVAEAFQEALFAAVNPGARSGVLRRVLGVDCAAEPLMAQSEIRAQLMKSGKPAYVEESCLDADTAYALVLALGGVPCYPILADGTTPMCEFEASPEQLASALAGREIWCAEFIPSRNTAAVVDHYATTLRRAGIVVLAGTEHNTVELSAITPECRGGAPVSGHAAELFWEGVCVVAAHQYLAARGRPGYVDARGQRNRDFATPEQRISAFARLGASVIEAFRRQACAQTAIAAAGTAPAAGSVRL